MFGTKEQVLFKMLDRRRRSLRMTYAALAKRSGVSEATVNRILSGRLPQANFAHVCAVAEALGVYLNRPIEIPLEEFRRRRATEKAKRLVSLLQGTSGLEAQGLDQETLEQMTLETVHDLMAGSKRELWGD